MGLSAHPRDEMPRANVEWVAQVSILRPGFPMRVNPFARRNPGLKIETWATHFTSWCSYIFGSPYSFSAIDLACVKSKR
jgi:hypothetical protein